MGAEDRSRLDVSRANVARTFARWTSRGGKDAFAADRDAADRLAGVNADVRVAARATAAWSPLMVRRLADEGFTQWLDLGCGMPPEVPGDSVAAVARAVHPAARVVYVDRDPVVCSHRRAVAETATVVRADIGDMPALLADAEVGRALDLARPVAVLALAVLHFLGDEDVVAVVGALRVLAAGSVLVVSHGQYRPELEAVAAEYSRAVAPVTLRTAEQIALLCEGWRVERPGVVPVTLWPGYPGAHDPGRPPPMLGGVFRLPRTAVGGDGIGVDGAGH